MQISQLMEFETIITERLLLKKVTPHELKHIFEKYSRDEAKEFFGFTSDDEYTSEKRKSDIGYTSYNRSILQFLFVDKETQKTIGRGAFHNWFFLHHRSELGYLISDVNFRQKGLMNEALKAIMDYGFTKMNLHRIEAFTGTDNIASIRLLEKNGFTREAVLREHYLLDGAFVDSIVFSKLKHEHKS
jgi:ribosomal-protein-alanine N-acetyltransferase